MGTTRETTCIIEHEGQRCENAAEWMPRFMFAGAWLEARALFCGRHLLNEGMLYTSAMVAKNWAVYTDTFQKLKSRAPSNPNDMLLQFIRLEDSMLLAGDPDPNAPPETIN